MPRTVAATGKFETLYVVVESLAEVASTCHSDSHLLSREPRTRGLVSARAQGDATGMSSSWQAASH